MKRLTLILISLCLLTVNADAATRFWVGGTGTWDAATTTHWSATSGGAGGVSVPGAADDVTLDAASGGGTVTVNFGGTITVLSLTMGAFTGTLDFSVNNNSVTLSSSTGFVGSGAGVRTLKLGNGTWTLTNATSGATQWNMTTTTNLTFLANSSTIKFSATSANARTMAPGTLTYNNLIADANSSGGGVTLGTGVAVFNNITLTAPATLNLPSGTTTTATSITSVGTSSNQNFIVSTGITSGLATLSVASGTQSMSWTSFRGITFTGGATFLASSSFDGGLNSGVTFSGGGGACILGGWLLWRDMPEHLNDNFPAWLDKAA